MIAQEARTPPDQGVCFPPEKPKMNLSGRFYALTNEERENQAGLIDGDRQNTTLRGWKNFYENEAFRCLGMDRQQAPAVAGGYKPGHSTLPFRLAQICEGSRSTAGIPNRDSALSTPPNQLPCALW